MDAEQNSGKQEKAKRKSFVSFRKSFSSLMDAGSTKNKGNDLDENSADQELEDAPVGRRASEPDAGIASPGDGISEVAGSDAANSPKQKKSKRFSLKGVTKLFRSNSLKSTASQEVIDAADNVGGAEEDAGFDESRMSEASASTAGVDAAGVPKKKKSKIFSTKSFTKMFRSNSLTSANGTDAPNLGDGASVDENGARTIPPKRKSFFSFKKDHGDKSSVGTPPADASARNSPSAPVEDSYSGPVSPTFERSATSMDDDEEVTQIDAAQLANSSFFNPSKSSVLGKAVPVSPPRAQSSNNSASKLFQQVDESDTNVTEEPSPKPVRGATKIPQPTSAEKKADDLEDTRRESYTSPRSTGNDTRGRMGSIREEETTDMETTIESAAKVATTTKAAAFPPAATISTKQASSPAPVAAAVTSPKQARSLVPAAASPKVVSPVRQTKQLTPAVSPQSVPVVELTIPDSELFTSPEPNQAARTDRSLSMQSEQPLSPMQNATSSTPGGAALDSESGSGKTKKPSTLFKSAAKMIRRSILGSPAGGAAGTPPPPPPPAPDDSPTMTSAAQQDTMLTEEDNFRPFGQSSPVKQGERSPHHQPFDGQPSNFRPSSPARSSPVPSHASSRSPEKFIFDVAPSVSRKSPSEISDANEPPKSVFVIAAQAGNENLAELRLSLPNSSESELAALLVAPSPNVSVTKLILRNNAIISPERFSFGIRFDHLTDLDLGYNNIAGAIKGLPQTLVRLDLSHNRITNVSSVLSCVNLVELNLSHNDIKSFHSLPPKLERLDLAHNSITAAMTLRTLALSPGIKCLDLRGNAVILEVVEWKVVLRTILTQLLELNGRAIPKPKKPITVPAVAATKTESPPKPRTGAAAREEQRVNDAVRTRMHSLKLELLKETQETLGRSMVPKVKSIRPEDLEGLSKRLAAPTKALTHKTTAAPLVAPLFSNRDLIQRKSVQPLASTTPRGGDVDLTAWLNKAKQNIFKAVKAVIRAVKLSDEEEVEVDDIMSLSASINRLELFTTRDLPLKIEYAIEKLVDGDVLKRKIATAREQRDLIGQLLQQVDSALLLSAQGAFKLRDAVDSAMNSGPGLIAYTTLLRTFDASFDPSILTARRNSPRQVGLSTLNDNQGSFVDDRSSERRQQGANSQDDYSYRVKDLSASRNTSPSRVKPVASTREGYTEGKQNERDSAAPGQITPEAFMDRVRSRMTSRAFFGTAAQATYEGSAGGGFASQGEPESKAKSSGGPAPSTRAPPSTTLFAADEDAPPPPPPSDKKTVAQAAAERVAARVSRSLSQRNLESKAEADSLPEAPQSVVVALSSGASVEELPPPPPETSPLSYVSEFQIDKQRESDVVGTQQELALGGSWDASSLVSAPVPAFQAPYHAADEVLFEPYHKEALLESQHQEQEEMGYNYDEQYQLRDTYQYPEEDQDTYQAQYAEEYQQQEYQEDYRGLDSYQQEQEQDQRDRDEAEAYRLFLLAAAEEDMANEAAHADYTVPDMAERNLPSAREEVQVQAEVYSAPSGTAAATAPAPANEKALLGRETSEFSLPIPPIAPVVQRSSSEGLDASFLVPPEVEPLASAPPAPPAPPVPVLPAVVDTVSVAERADSGSRSNTESPVPTDDAGDGDTSKMSAKDRIKARLAKNKKT